MLDRVARPDHRGRRFGEDHRLFRQVLRGVQRRGTFRDMFDIVQPDAEDVLARPRDRRQQASHWPARWRCRWRKSPSASSRQARSVSRPGRPASIRPSMVSGRSSPQASPSAATSTTRSPTITPSRAAPRPRRDRLQVSLFFLTAAADGRRFRRRPASRYRPSARITGRSDRQNRQASSRSEPLTCSCQAQDGTQKISRSDQSKRLPLMIEWPAPLAT